MLTFKQFIAEQQELSLENFEIEESEVDDWKEVQAMDKGSILSGKRTDINNRIAYLTAVFNFQKKYGKDTKTVKDKIGQANRSLAQASSQ